MIVDQQRGDAEGLTVRIREDPAAPRRSHSLGTSLSNLFGVLVMARSSVIMAICTPLTTRAIRQAIFEKVSLVLWFEPGEV